jgi:hypothetical protein
MDPGCGMARRGATEKKANGRRCCLRIKFVKYLQGEFKNPAFRSKGSSKTPPTKTNPSFCRKLLQNNLEKIEIKPFTGFFGRIFIAFLGVSRTAISDLS